MRSTMSLLVVGLTAFLIAGCSDDDGGNCRSVYCDDMGCHACDTDSCFCWDINNTPCENGCAVDEFCTPEGICAQLCEFDGNCAEGERCLPEGYCGPREEPNLQCTTDNDCGTGLICEPDGEGGKTCQPAQCTKDEDCEEGYVCAECGRCVPEENPVCGDTKTYCTSNGECGEGRECNVAGKCIYQCLESVDCPYGQICSESSVCVDDSNPTHEDACVMSSDCTGVANCEGGCLCINTYCHPLCDANEDCGLLEICDMGVCRANYRPE